MGRKAKIDATIGGHIRARKRSLYSKGATASTSYELVRREPVADDRHKRMFSLGSLKEPVRHESDIVRFWLTAFFRMRRHGLDEHQRRHVASEMVRKGARPPTAAECVGFANARSLWPDIKHWVAAS
jgi:hypothetical protein